MLSSKKRTYDVEEVNINNSNHEPKSGGGDGDESLTGSNYYGGSKSSRTLNDKRVDSDWNLTLYNGITSNGSACSLLTIQRNRHLHPHNRKKTKRNNQRYIHDGCIVRGFLAIPTTFTTALTCSIYNSAQENSFVPKKRIAKRNE
jgi:hypothetical protein